MINLTVAAELPLHIDVLEIEHVVVTPSSVKLNLWSDDVTAAALEKAQTPAAEKLRTAVRQMLKHGKFKASGRSKPAQEYLLRCAQEDGGAAAHQRPGRCAKHLQPVWRLAHFVAFHRPVVSQSLGPLRTG